MHVNQRKEDSMFGIKRSPRVTWRKPLFFILYFLEFLKLLNLITLGETPPSMELYARYQGLIELFINIPMTEARDFHCQSHVFENLEKRSIPSDHAAVACGFFKLRLIGDTRANAFQVGCPNIPSSVLFLKRLDDGHQCPADPFGALEDFNNILEKAQRLTVRELSRKTPDSLGAKLLTASTTSRAYRNRHLGTLMRCCEAWEPVGKCFDPRFECINVHGLSQIIASLTRENLAEREAEIGNLSWRSVDLDSALGVPRNRCSAAFTLLLTDEDGHPLENEDESGRRLREY